MTDNDELLFDNKSQRLFSALELYGKTHADLEQDLYIMKEWIKTQKHLPEMPKDTFLTNMLITNKFSIEKCKKKLDMYYSLRTLIPELFENTNPKLPHMKIAAQTMCHVTMPKVTKEGYRVNYVTLLNTNIENFSPYDITAHCMNLFEIKLQNDVLLGEIYIIDMANYSFAHISKFTPMHIKKTFAVAEKAYTNSIKQIHYINIPQYVEGLINLIKQIVKPKIAERIFAHKDVEVLKKYLPIDLLPKEYGGNEYSLDDLQGMWMDQLKKHQDRFEVLSKLKVDESKRPAPLINDEVLGFHGNFKKLNVD